MNVPFNCICLPAKKTQPLTGGSLCDLKLIYSYIISVWKPFRLCFLPFFFFESCARLSNEKERDDLVGENTSEMQDGSKE